MTYRLAQRLTDFKPVALIQFVGNAPAKDRSEAELVTSLDPLISSRCWMDLTLLRDRSERQPRGKLWLAR